MKRGPYKNREDVFNKVRELRKKGLGYKSISDKTGIASGTVRHWVSDIKNTADVKIAHSAAMKKLRRPINELVKTSTVRKRLLEIRPYACELCSNKTWRGSPIWIEVHHIDGNNKNNDLGNLQLLCLNCHATTKNYRYKGRVKIAK